MLKENLIRPVTILSTLAAAGVGALLAMLVTDTKPSIVSAVDRHRQENAIMMIDFALNAQRHKGLSPPEAVREAELMRSDQS